MRRGEPHFNLSDQEWKALGIALNWTRSYFDSRPANVLIGGHGFDKTMRQAGMAAIIASAEGHPIFLPVLTAIVMDVGRVHVKPSTWYETITDKFLSRVGLQRIIHQDPRTTNYQHGQLSREIIETQLFKSLDILTPEDKVIVGNAAEDHSKLNKYVRRNYVAEIVMDADRLDCLGALGPLRSASWLHNLSIILPDEVNTWSVDGQQKTMWQDMSVRHMEWVDMLWTDTARKIAAPRVQAYREYLARLKEETAVSYDAFKRLGIGLEWSEIISYMLL